MKRLVIVLLPLISFVTGWIAHSVFNNIGARFPIESVKEEIKRPMDRYSIENLSKTDFRPGKLEIKDVLTDKEDYTSYLFEFTFNPNLDKVTMKKTSGQINIPKEGSSFPLILMLRGYIDKETFTTGDGTRRAAEFFAENGFLTVAPDFLGYGESDDESGNIFETRFQTYIAVLSLIKSLDQIDKWNGEDVFLWGHSNGGHIALTTLEITGANYPTSLWAPVSKPFPYSILYFTNDSVDGGKLIRRELAKFEDAYDVEKYSSTNYLDRINAPILVQQGGSDEAVPLSWSNELVQKLKKLDKEVTYYTYPKTDHNMRPTWNEAVAKDLEFYKSHLK